MVSLQLLRINAVTVESNVHTCTLLEGVIWVISLEMIVGSGQPVGRFCFHGNHGGCLKERKQRQFAQRFLSWGRGQHHLRVGGIQRQARGSGSPTRSQKPKSQSGRACTWVPWPALSWEQDWDWTRSVAEPSGWSLTGCHLTSLQRDLQEAGQTLGSTSVGVGRSPGLVAADCGACSVSRVVCLLSVCNSVSPLRGVSISAGVCTGP